MFRQLSTLKCAVIPATALFLFSAAGFSETKEKKEFYVSPDHVFVPQGYDNTDVNVEIVMTVSLPNKCFQLVGTPEVDSSQLAVGVIKVKQKALYRPELICAQSSTESNIVVANLGHELPVGKYEIQVEHSDDPTNPVRAPLNIAESTSPDVDNYNYLNITGAFITKKEIKPAAQADAVADSQKQFQRFLNLQGEHKNACATIHDVEITPDLDHNIIEVLPIVDINENGECADETAEVWASLELPKVPKGTYLVHIRSALGTSRNLILSL